MSESDRSFDVDGELPAGSFVLEASAGTGKTFSIAHLALRFVAEQGVPIERLVVVTFTNAATAELRDRVRNRLAAALDALEQGPPDGADPALAGFARRHAGSLDVTRRLGRALADFDRARIYTIHNFCDRLLARNGLELGVDPDARLSADAHDILRHLVHDYRGRLTARDEFALTYHAMGALSLEALSELATLALGNPTAGILDAPIDGAGVPSADEIADVHRELARVRSAPFDDYQARIRAAARMGLLTASAPSGEKHLDKTFHELARFLEDPTGDAASSTVMRFVLDPSTKQVKKTPESLLRELSEHDVASAIRAFFELDTRLSLAAEARLVHCIHEFVAFTRERAEAEKRALGIRTFDDLLHLVHRALREHGDVLASRLASDLDVALIDEFQDTDPIQWSIFGTLFLRPGKRIVLIGDPKQAIYGFRSADLATYFRAVESIETHLSLSQNFRTDGRVIAALERVYTQAEDPFGDAGREKRVRYASVSAAHEAARTDDAEGCRAPVLLFGDLARSASTGDIPATTADAVIRFLGLGTLVDRGGGAMTPARPADCAVLVRNNHVAREIRAALRKRGIQAIVRASGSVFESAEASELALVLRAAITPLDASAVASAIATEFVCGRIDDALEFRANEAARERWVNRFRDLHDRLVSRGFSAFFQAFVREFEPLERVLRTSEGPRRATNLLHLAELLTELEEQEHLGPEALLSRLLAAAADASDDDAKKLRLESDAGAVEIVTIHSAKGLEWPFVFCDSLGKGQMGGGKPPKYVRVRRPDGSSFIGRTPASPSPDHLEAEANARAEEHRLAYVALTRAKHRVFVNVRKSKRGQPPAISLFANVTGADQDSVAALAATVAGSEGAVAFFDSSRRDVVATVDETPAIPPPLAFTREAPLDTAFRNASYTSLVRGARRDQVGLRGGRDERAGEPSATTEMPALDAWSALPAGAAFGTEVHTALERTRTFDATGLAAVLGPFREGDARAALPGLLGDALATPLFPGSAFRLADLDPAKTLREVEFRLPAGGGLTGGGARLSASALARVLRAHDRPAFPASYAERAGRFALETPLGGYLIGSFDLVFEHEGRLYVADYKTNRLGASAGAYEPSRLLAAMVEHDYLLQGLLYALALHRHLAGREPSYSYEARFGGVAYLFVRGMDGTPGRGVHVDRPPLGQLEALERALGLAPVERRAA